MEEETIAGTEQQNTPERQGVMGANIADTSATNNPMELVVTPKEVSNNLQNLRDGELQVITQLNIPQFRDFMSKIFGQQFGTIMEQAIPEPQPQPQVSPQGESPSPMTGGGMMQPPVTA